VLIIQAIQFQNVIRLGFQKIIFRTNRFYTTVILEKKGRKNPNLATMYWLFSLNLLRWNPSFHLKLHKIFRSRYKKFHVKFQKIVEKRKILLAFDDVIAQLVCWLISLQRIRLIYFS